MTSFTQRSGPQIDFLNGRVMRLKGPDGTADMVRNSRTGVYSAPTSSVDASVPQATCGTPKQKPWYVFVLLGAIGGGMLVGGGFLIRDYRRKKS